MEDHEAIHRRLVYSLGITQEEVRQFYGGWAGKYEEDNVRLGYTGHYLLAGAVDAALQRGGHAGLTQASVLDVACGTGLLGTALANRGAKATVGTQR